VLVSQSPALDEYISTLKSPISRIKVRERLDQVFKALDIPGPSVEERAEIFQKKQETTPNGSTLK
jgi:hypothetical protein